MFLGWDVIPFLDIGKGYNECEESDGICQVRFLLAFGLYLC